MGEKILIIGAILIIIEGFVPGIGVFGISGLIALILGIILISPNIYYAMAIIFIITGIFTIIIAFIAKKLPKGSLYRTLFLKTNLSNKEGFLSSKENSSYLNEIMTVDTFLRPSGRIKNSESLLFDAISEGEFIEKGEKVRVIGNKGYILVVKKLEE